MQKYLLSKATSNAWEFAADEFTDQPPEELVVQSVRAQLLNFLPQEIPYQLKSELEFYTREKGNYIIHRLKILKLVLFSE